MLPVSPVEWFAVYIGRYTHFLDFLVVVASFAIFSLVVVVVGSFAVGC